MSQQIGILGTSGFAREVADLAEDQGYRVLFVARDLAEQQSLKMGDAVILEADLPLYPALPLAIGIGDNALRERVALRHAGRQFPALLHSSATFGRGQRATILATEGVLVCAGVRFTNSITVGKFSVFNLNATIGHDVVVAAFVNIAPGANISGNVQLDERCWIGTAAAVNQGAPGAPLRVGADTMVGSGSVVVKDCDSQAVYVGIPAKRIK